MLNSNVTGSTHDGPAPTSPKSMSTGWFAPSNKMLVPCILGIDEDELKLVLDHSEGHASDDVTEGAYSKARRPKREEAILTAWSGLLDGAAAAMDLGNLGDAAGRHAGTPAGKGSGDGGSEGCA